MNKETKIFIDVDNTILEHCIYRASNSEERLFTALAKYPEDNLEVIKTLYKDSLCPEPEIIRALLKLDNVYILTKYNSDVYEQQKRIKMAEVLKMTVNEMESLTDSKGNPKYLGVDQKDSKVRVIKDMFGLDNLNSYILIDDFSENIIEWEENGGIGIKFYNEYSSALHPTNGLSISNYKMFEYYLNQRNLSNLLITGQNRYKLRELIQNLSMVGKFNKLDINQIVVEDIKNNLKVSNPVENTKYSHYNFMIEYFHFMNNSKKDYWTSRFDVEVQKEMYLGHDKNIVSSTFELNPNDFNSLDTLSVKINSDKDSNEHPYDVYLTLEDERFIDDIDDTYAKIINVMKLLLCNS